MHMIHVQGDVVNDLVSLVHCPVLRNRNKHDNYRYVVNRADRIDATQQTRDVLTQCWGHAGPSSKTVGQQ